MWQNRAPHPILRRNTVAGKRVSEFRTERERLNAKVLAAGNLTINRFFNLDTRCYEAGALDAKTKELLGLAASTVLRCDDCISYHLVRSVEEGASDPEIHETLAVGLVVGGSITIPHLRRAFDFLSELREAGTDTKSPGGGSGSGIEAGRGSKPGGGEPHSHHS
jgi:AhpD family alkylhydroperoxidase